MTSIRVQSALLLAGAALAICGCNGLSESVLGVTAISTVLPTGEVLSVVNPTTPDAGGSAVFNITEWSRSDLGLNGQIKTVNSVPCSDPSITGGIGEFGEYAPYDVKIAGTSLNQYWVTFSTSADGSWDSPLQYHLCAWNGTTWTHSLVQGIVRDLSVDSQGAMLARTVLSASVPSAGGASNPILYPPVNYSAIYLDHLTSTGVTTETVPGLSYCDSGPPGAPLLARSAGSHLWLSGPIVPPTTPPSQVNGNIYHRSQSDTDFELVAAGTTDENQQSSLPTIMVPDPSGALAVLIPDSPPCVDNALASQILCSNWDYNSERVALYGPESSGLVETFASPGSAPSNQQRGVHALGGTSVTDLWIATVDIGTQPTQDCYTSAPTNWDQTEGTTVCNPARGPAFTWYFSHFGSSWTQVGTSPSQGGEPVLPIAVISPSVGAAVFVQLTNGTTDSNMNDNEVYPFSATN